MPRDSLEPGVAEGFGELVLVVGRSKDVVLLAQDKIQAVIVDIPVKMKYESLISDSKKVGMSC